MLTLKRLGIDTYKENVVYIRKHCHVCQAEGFEVQARVMVKSSRKQAIATLQFISSDIIAPSEASLSEYLWKYLEVQEGDTISLGHAKPAASLSFVRSKMYGNNLTHGQLKSIIDDVTQGNYSEIMIAAFLTACVGNKLSRDEVIDLTKTMVEAGNKINWNHSMVVDKHCVGGLPGNRTTPIVVPILTSLGFIMPKTSSRSITSPAGTADTMEVLAPVSLSLEAMKNVVHQEGGCIVWGGSVSLSPADDILIRVERVLDIDSEGQLIASVLSKKIAAGSTHVLIDIPVGPTAKVRGQKMADNLKSLFVHVGNALGLKIKVQFSEGIEPIGYGIGPALEARDVCAVLQNHAEAPMDLRERALQLAGQIIEFNPQYVVGSGYSTAKQVLESGQAWKKFKAICEAQGGMHDIPKAAYTYPVQTQQAGIVSGFDNRRIAKIAKLAGAPTDKAAGVDIHCKMNQRLEKGQPILTIHAESQGQLQYALDYLNENGSVVHIEHV